MPQPKSYRQRILVTYLAHASPEKCYDWLSDNRRRKKFEAFEWSELTTERKLLEFVLYRRKHPLIDLGLAEYGYTPFVLKRVFASEKSGLRCAVLANPALFKHQIFDHSPVIDLGSVIKRAKRSELEALALNLYLDDDFYEKLIERKEYFAELTDKDYKFMLCCLGNNPRLSTPYDETYLDGWTDYKYHNVFTLSWKLASTVPPSQEWAFVLFSLLRVALPPSGFENLEECIQRWRIDPPKKDDDKYYNPGHGHYLRSRLADLLEPNEALLASSDLALRLSFYRRFSPKQFKDWPNFLERDGEEFASEVMFNLNVWQSESERINLQSVAWRCPDSHASLSMPNLYRARQKDMEEQHPDWFVENGCSEQPETQVAKGKLITSLLKVALGKT